MKKRLLLILWLVLLTLPSFATSPTDLKPTPSPESGTVSPGSEKLNWPETLPMLSPEVAQAVGEIIDQQIDLAFAEGYKRGVIAWKPEAEYWKTKDHEAGALGWTNGFWIGTACGTVVTIGLTLVAQTLLHAGGSR